jgi:3'(2'), 5'-bisphosphate nucleotidase
MLSDLSAIARAAGQAVMHHYADAACAVTHKQDGSPLTAADEAADAVIRAGLSQLAPALPLVSEEGVTVEAASLGERFWLVDPLDGTREFVGRNGEFTVNIALIERGVPVLGVVYAPALRRLYGGAAACGAWMEDDTGRRPIACRRAEDDGVTVVASRSHACRKELQCFLLGRAVRSLVQVGSSLKFCLVAAGEADLYPRLGPTMEWDTAAGHAVLLAAGGQVRTLDGTLLSYGKPGYANPGFIAQGR